ncbi:glycosyltransferase family 2 protein [Aporhodopirellula aestuarii]|uniref:Glycosyltransferase n=1 Tax=Aporhodopirellula aestuarii TaxID=2950107 RepID=A0ABT0U189_9BACT|nr:glycosyltransferase [Aporhodopirellula aestuarii]MCM2370253.1 glycosyltransferase [Aporhodopirellula aestuarii]
MFSSLLNAPFFSVGQLSLLIGSVLLASSLVHFGGAWFFRVFIVGRRLARSESASDVGEDGKVSVLMSLRGCDPFLSETLARLLEQAYDNFEIILVIDSCRDPAWRVAQEIKSRSDTKDRLRIFELQNPAKTCSLKCSSLVQATEQMSADSEFVVMIDADVVPYANWLRDVLRPLTDPQVGVVTGIQWFAPEGLGYGSLLRSVWNSGAMVATAVNSNPWAGTCAMRCVELRRSGLIEKWKTSVVDDGPVKEAFDRLGLRVYFEPRLTMVNRDQCSLKFAGRYVTRMLTWSRIFEKTFINTVIHAVAVVGLLVAAIAMLVAAIVVQEGVAAMFLAASILVSNLIMFGGFVCAERSVRDAVSHCGGREQMTPMTWSRGTRVFALIPVCQVAHMIWTFQAIVARQASWRNITYRLYPQQRVEMVAYQPYAIDNTDTPPNTSI